MNIAAEQIEKMLALTSAFHHDMLLFDVTWLDTGRRFSLYFDCINCGAIAYIELMPTGSFFCDGSATTYYCEEF